MSSSFFKEPILNSPYAIPERHHPLDEKGQPLESPVVEGRRKSVFLTPIPKSRKGRRNPQGEQGTLGIDDEEISTESQKYSENTLINQIRRYVDDWRELKNPGAWGVTPVTQRLLSHWRTHNFNKIQPFFCQIEAVETAIWLTEVASKQKQYRPVWQSIEQANKDANPEIMRLAMKMATGTGKTTVMAMLIAWQTLNAVRMQNSGKYSRGFLIVAPGITIRDRLRVLLPEDSESYYANRELVPLDMLPDLGKARIVIQNYHAFQNRETVKMSAVGRKFLQGRDEPIKTKETDGQMLQRACGSLLSMKNVVVINDEAHHCYEEKPNSDEEDLATEEKDEAQKNSEAARLWINGIKALKKKVKVQAVYDLSATPFFLRGSGYAEGTLFPWVVSDFSLMDAIESGIVKLPRIPVDDNIVEADKPIYRDLWGHLKEQGYSLPKKGAKKAEDLDPHKLPTPVQTALNSLYDHYIKIDKEWRAAGVKVPPVFIVVCNNTSTSKMVYEWISGWARESDDIESDDWHLGHLELFRNYDERGERLKRPNTLLIDSVQLESGDALDKGFRKFAEPEIEQFKRESLERGKSQKEVENTSDQELLREVMNTVGKEGKLGGNIRCVVSVSMLTEGWDTNTVTHILGLRAFGTQLLCEQVVGRALRRLSYDLNDQQLFDTEYANILGIPFDFTASPVVAKPTKPKPSTRVYAIKERETEHEIRFPRVSGYRKDFEPDKIKAEFTEDSRLVIDPRKVGATRTVLAGIVGEDLEIGPDYMKEMRTSEISFKLAKILLLQRYKKADESIPMHLFTPLQQTTRRWIEEGYLECVGEGTVNGMVLYQDIAEEAIELIDAAIQRTMGGEAGIKALIDPYNPHGSSRHVSFNTTKTIFHETIKSHVNLVICDSTWEREFTRVLEAHSRVLSYVKNHGLQFEVPYMVGTSARRYIPDFIAKVDDGQDDPLNLVIEVKGRRGVDEQIKAETMRTKWAPGVNALGTFGRWDFLELLDVFEMEAELGQKIEQEFNKSLEEAVVRNAKSGETV